MTSRGLPRGPVPARSGAGATVVAAALLSLVWLAGAALRLGWRAPETGAGRMAVFALELAAIAVPVILIWAAALAFRQSREARDEAARLGLAIGEMRATYLDRKEAAKRASQPAPPPELPPAPVPAAPARRIVPAPATEALGADTGAAVTSPAQPELSLEPAFEPTTLTRTAFVRALDFPANAADRDGFRALRLARRDPRAARLVRSSQDVLTLLSEDGIYMDDFSPDRARPELWRRFAQGERGRTLADLGAIRDHSALALTTARMRRDPIFRDVAHHFLRLFDRTFAAFEVGASDADLAAFADTRTSRAFMLLARVAGTFD